MFMFWMKSRLMEEAGSGTGGGGAAGGNSGGGAAAFAAAFDPQAFMTTLLGEFDKRVNALDKKFNKLSETITTSAAAATANGGNNGGTGTGTGSEGGTGGAAEQPKESKTIADLNLRLSQLETARKADANEIESWKKRAADEEAKRLETDRLAAFDHAIDEIPFVSPKAKQQFKDAYLSKVKRDDDGNYIVETDKGPMSHDLYLKAQAEESPHFLAPTGSGGSGATAGTKQGMTRLTDINKMSSSEIMSMKPEERNAALATALTVATGRQ